MIALWAQLSSEQRALIALAVLCDGQDAAIHLGIDSQHGERLAAAALEACMLEPEARAAVMGSELRKALEEMSR